MMSAGRLKFKNSKYYKYQTTNPVSRWLVSGFYNKIIELVNKAEFDSVLDIGCGEGHLMSNLKPLIVHKRCVAIDNDPGEVKDAKRNLPFAEVQVGSVYALPFENDSFDLVMCTEVMEHLENPDAALEEIKRVSSRYVLLSVPREPIWRLLNMLRGKYLTEFGNTTGHLNHWNTSAYVRLVSQYLKVIEVKQPLPWTLLLAKKD